MPEQTVDKQKELGLKSDPFQDAARLFCSWNAKHSADTQLSQACTNIMARMDAGKEVGSDFMNVVAPPFVEQQHIGNGVYQGVEVKSADALQKFPNVFGSVPQVGAKDSVGAPLPTEHIVPVLDTASVQLSSTSTAQPVEPVEPVEPVAPQKK